jgi:DNA-binding GntR family transcriptional regulator
MSVSFELKPGERLNEGEPAKRLGVSRTPLREALNRLNT